MTVIMPTKEQNILDGLRPKSSTFFKFIYGSKLFQPSPVEITSLLSPFPTSWWVLIGAAVGAVTSYYLIHLGSVQILPVLSAFVAQYAKILCKKLGSKFLHAIRVFAAIYLSNVYLAQLTRLIIAPDVSIADRVLQELLFQDNFSLQVFHGQYDYLQSVILQFNKTAPHLRNGHQLVKDHLKPINIGSMHSEGRIHFLQLESHA